eukprot:scaffold1996_cov127-Cylindrotheca_fusiformis.AAC.19
MISDTNWIGIELDVKVKRLPTKNPWSDCGWLANESSELEDSSPNTRMKPKVLGTVPQMLVDATGPSPT